MIMCALALCHSNADVERALSINKRMLTKQNVSVKDETITGLTATKAAVQDYGGEIMYQLPWTYSRLLKSHHLYTEHLRQESKEKYKGSGKGKSRNSKREN